MGQYRKCNDIAIGPQVNGSVESVFQITDVLRVGPGIGNTAEDGCRFCCPLVACVLLIAVSPRDIPSSPALTEWSRIIRWNGRCAVDVAGRIGDDRQERQLRNERFRFLRVVTGRAVVARGAFEY